MGRKQTSPDFREVVIKLHLEHRSLGEIAKTVNKAKSTIQHIVSVYKKQAVCNIQQGRGGKYFQWKGRTRCYSNYTEKSTHFQFDCPTNGCQQLQKTCLCSNHTKVIKPERYFSRTARRKPLISDVNKLKRVQFANTHLSQDISFWKSVIFTDESKYNVFGYDGPAKVWR